MTPRQRRFVEEYMIDLNGKQAALRAGYAPSAAKNRSYILLRQPEIAAAVAEAMMERSRRTGITADKVLNEYARLAFSDLRQVTDWGPDGVLPKAAKDLNPDQARAIAEVTETKSKTGGGTVRVKLHDKKGALDALARHLGLFTDKPDPDGKVAKPPKLRVIIDKGDAGAGH
ncbi:MAG: terminase small subunit [Pseudomonadota bacterium]